MRFFAYFVIPALGVHAISIVGSQSSTGAGILSRQIHNADFDKSFTSSDYHGEHNAKRNFFARIAHTIALATGTNKNHQVMNFHDDKLSVGQAIESRQLGAASSIHDTSGPSGAIPSSALSIRQRDIAGTGTKKDHQVMNPNDEKPSVGQVIQSRQLGVDTSVSNASGPSGALPSSALSIRQRDLADDARSVLSNNVPLNSSPIGSNSIDTVQTSGKGVTGAPSGISAAVNDNSGQGTACGQSTPTVPCESVLPIDDIASPLNAVL